MSHVEEALSCTGKIVTDTFVVGRTQKGFITTIIAFISSIITGNEIFIFLIFILYLLDLILGVRKAVYLKNFTSRKFFMGATKILIYGIFILVGASLDAVIFDQTGIGTFLATTLGISEPNLFLGAVVGFIIITDSISIFENLEELGYKTPKFISGFLKSSKNKLESRFQVKEEEK